MIPRSYTGIVERGAGKGVQLGFPTLNIPVDDASLGGIYAAIVTIKGTTYHAAAYADTKRKLLEAHVLNFCGDLYGLTIEVTLVHMIREGRRFDSTEELTQAIAADIHAIEEYFAGL